MTILKDKVYGLHKIFQEQIIGTEKINFLGDIFKFIEYFFRILGVSPIFGVYSGTRAWTTNINTYYANDVLAVVTSPLLNVTDIQNPIVQFKIRYSLEVRVDFWNNNLIHFQQEGYDGVCFQINMNGSDWITVGQGPPDPYFYKRNWYDGYAIAIPGNDNQAWSTSSYCLFFFFFF